MELTTLAHRPDLREQTIALIENSFGYSSEFRFEIDFAPLMTLENAINNFIAIHNNIVIGHIGLKKRRLQFEKSSWEIGLLGGICTSKNHRGRGVFSSLLKALFEREQDLSLYLLWSDQIDLYSKYGFFLALEQNQYSSTLSLASGLFLQTKWSELNSSKKEQIIQVYKEKVQTNFTTLSRKDEDWNEIELITSTDLYIQQSNNKVLNYFFKNKGQDLNGIIHETSVLPDSPYFDETLALGTVWSPLKSTHISSQEQFACLLKIGQKDAFERFILAATEGKIILEYLDHLECKVNDTIMSYPELICGLWGPIPKPEWSGMVKPIYISGLDSI